VHSRTLSSQISRSDWMWRLIDLF